jgi:hypothetical protein
MTKLQNQKIAHRWKRRPRNTKSSFKYIFWSLGLAMVMFSLATVILLKEWLTFLSIPCKITDPEANLYRVEGGVKKDSTEILGHWKLISAIDQYTYKDATGAYVSYERYKPWHDQSFMTITSDSLFCNHYPFWDESRRPYTVDKDSMYFTYDIELDGDYPPHAMYYEFHGDTLVLISWPYDICDQVEYLYYLKDDSTHFSND